MTPINEDLYQAGRADAWRSYEPDEPAGDPVGADEDYDLGWWNGIGQVQAWHAGYAASLAGVHVSPYEAPEDEELRAFWLAGYAAAMESGEGRHAV